jgi:hypothetical protein
MFVLLGVLILAVAGLLLYDHQRASTSIAPLPAPYTYTVQQAVHPTVHYNQSSFFSSTPSPTNTAYIADITKSIDAQFHYFYSGSKVTDLSYSYRATATLRSTFGTDNSPGGVANVWNRQYQLLEPTAGTKTAKTLTFDPVVQIPFADYKTDIDQFKNSFKAPLNGEMVVNFEMQVSGKVNGTPFTDTKISTITAPLDQLIYQLGVKFAKIDHEQVQPASSKRLADTINEYELPVAVLLTALGVSYVVYGFRKQIFKTPYMRELERIYRYHDGIIIRASRPTNLTGKDMVPVQSFDDLLNLEEELKTPIVASPAGANATQFMITRDDIVYVYTLGDFSMADPPQPPAQPRPAKPAPTQPQPQPQKPTPPTPPAPAPIQPGKHKHPVNKRVSG